MTRYECNRCNNIVAEDDVISIKELKIERRNQDELLAMDKRRNQGY